MCVKGCLFLNGGCFTVCFCVVSKEAVFKGLSLVWVYEGVCVGRADVQEGVFKVSFCRGGCCKVFFCDWLVFEGLVFQGCFVRRDVCEGCFV